MEEKIYERQVTKQSLAQRVIDEHQIERHFTANDLRDLYIFKPDRLDDPNQPERPTPKLPRVGTLMDEYLAHRLTVDHKHDITLSQGKLTDT